MSSSLATFHLIPTRNAWLNDGVLWLMFANRIDTIFCVL